MKGREIMENQLMSLCENGKVSSLELVEQINFFRKDIEGKNELRHDTLRNIIKDEFEEELLSQEILEKVSESTGGRPSKYFELTPSQAKQVLVRESKSVRKAVIAYIEKLEETIKSQQVPQTYAAALLEAGRLALELEQANDKVLVLEHRVAEYEPKITYYDQILDCADAVAISVIASDYGLSARRLNTILYENRIQRRVGNTWILYSEHMGKGYTQSKTTTYHSQYGSGASISTVWTQKGRLMIHELLTGLGIVANFDKE